MTDLDPAPRSSVARAGRISTRSVDEYLSTDFTDVERRLVRLRSMSQDALHTLVTFAHSHYRWPYEIRNEAPMHEQNQMSITTTTMILHAMAVALGEIEGSTLAPTVQTSQPLRSLESGDRQRIEDIAQGLRDQLLSPGGDGTDDRGPLTVSKTWGDDDPLTLAWLYEFGGSREFSSREWSPVQAKIRAIARLKIAEAVEDLDRPVLKGNLFESHGITAVPHPFPMLRLVQLHRMVPSDPGDIEGHGTSRLQAWFFDQVHRELSQSEIQDGEFDPAALVFSVEAILQLNKHAMRRSLLDRVMRVFLDGRNRATHWRPVRPLTVTAQGAVLLPQSIEVANSFLRICRLLDEGGSGDRLFAQSLESLCAYADWLETRCTRVRTADGGYYWGWQSEHTFAPDTVHMWVTSQVLLFLQHYASMLDRHRARESRVIATLNSPDDSSPAKERWDEAREHEPLLGLGDDHVYQIYGQVHKRFVEPRRNRERGARLAYSMVVHGPPGTGKTNFAKQLARALSYDFLSITPSDFIRLGEAGVEERARQLFQVLSAQSDLVVLFDEIDRLLLDRDSSEYGSQSDMFQFMTPSMLTKLAGLRKAEKVVFLIATNYAERIDPAIKRPGRIDVVLPLLPPDQRQRTRIVKKLLVHPKQTKSTWVADHCEEVAAWVAHATPLYVFKELQRFVKQDLPFTDVLNQDCLENELQELTRTYPASISLSNYKNRFRNNRLRGNSELGLMTEFTMLAYLLFEAGKDLPDEWMRAVIRTAATTLEKDVVSDEFLAWAGVH